MSLQWRNKSGELDVFEAARYFSNVNEHQTSPTRSSLDMPTTRHSTTIPPHTHSSITNQKQMNEKHNKYKQPSSPGGRLASFLNSFFNQTTLKKKKQKSKDVDEESHTGRRKRRSSISHFRIATFASNVVDDDDDCKSSISSVSASYANKPLNSYKEFGKTKSRMVLDSLVEEFKGRNGVSEKLSHVDDGMESDSSSDLFDLPNHDLDFYPTGLPVYETTRVDRIKIDGARLLKNY